jgi:hypothetical protein
MQSGLSNNKSQTLTIMKCVYTLIIMLRVRNGAVLKDLEIPPETIQRLRQILDKTSFTNYKKREFIRSLTGNTCSPCSICFDIPTKVLSYDVGDRNFPMKKIEF